MPKEQKKLITVINKIEKNTADNFLHILPVYNTSYAIDTNSQTWKTLSAIIYKATEEIAYADTKHSSFCPIIGEIYLLKGIALFYQKQYQRAYQSFDIIEKEYPQSACLVESYIWLARTAIYLHAYEQTEFFLSEVETQIEDLQTNVLVDYHNVAAEYYIQIGDYKNALEHLTASINIGSPLNTRLSFIAAQIAEYLKFYHSAFQYYDNVYRKYDNVYQKLFTNNLMKSYAQVHRHLCEKRMERQYIDSLMDKQWKENHPVPEDFEPTMVESPYDRWLLEGNYPYYFSDYAAMFFLDESFNDFLYDEDDEDSNYFHANYFDGENDGGEMPLSDEALELIFENWDLVSVHIPKTDLRETVYIPLVSNAKEYKLPHFGAVVSRFGWRRIRYHFGTDFKGAIGDSIFCLFDGVVRIAVKNKTYGDVIIVRHYNGLETFYAHCSKMLVAPNQEVKAGELIGLVGNTGRSKGPHLHLETRYKGAAFNPEYMIDFENKRLKSDTLVLTKETFNYKNVYSSPVSNSSSGTSKTTTTSSTSTVSAPPGAKYHQVKSGDTLLGIAKKYKTTVGNIKKMNGLKSDAINAGQRLRVL